jgi:hypothetical protein
MRLGKETYGDLDDPLVAASCRKVACRYVGGSFPVSWIGKADVASNTLALALAVKAQIDIVGTEPVVVPSVVRRQLGLEPRAFQRALDALERAGVIRTERHPGQATRIWLLDKP